VATDRLEDPATGPGERPALIEAVRGLETATLERRDALGV